MSVEDFFVKIPELCGAKNPERWAWIIENVYTAELAGGTPFDRNTNDLFDIDNRLEIPFAFKAADDGAKEQCKRLVKIIMLSHYVKEHGEKQHQSTLDNLVAEASAASVSYPQVESVMSVEAAQSSMWDD